MTGKTFIPSHLLQGEGAPLHVPPPGKPPHFLSAKGEGLQEAKGTSVSLGLPQKPSLGGQLRAQSEPGVPSEHAGCMALAVVLCCKANVVWSKEG